MNFNYHNPGTFSLYKPKCPKMLCAIILKHWHIVALLFIFNTSVAQNLIANNSFEDVNICQEYHQACSPSAWFYIQNLTVGYASIDNVKSPTGEKHLNITVARKDSAMRQYWETMLLCKVEAGKKYKIKAKIASMNTGPNLSDLGFYFTNGFIFSQKDTVLQPTAYFNFAGIKPRNMKGGWYDVQKEILIASDAQYLIIGNFSNQADSEIFKERNNPFQTITILVDDLVLEPLLAEACPESKLRTDSLYSVHRRHSTAIQNRALGGDSAAIINPVKLLKPLIDTIVIKDILFKTNNYILEKDSVLDKYENLLMQTNISMIKITGYTDKSGSEEFNKTLSEKRAKFIADLLKQKFQLPRTIKIEYQGKGISTTSTNKSDNRRVEILIIH